MPQIPTSDKERGPRSLKRMALAVALRNIASITDVGEMAFADVKPILMHIENPAQLHLLETNCPQLAAETDQMAVVWGRLLTKKVPGWDKKGFLTDEELQTMSWIDIYTTVKAAMDAEMAAAEDRLKQKMAGFTKAKEEKAALFLSESAARQIPGVVQRRRAPGGGNAGQSVLNFSSGSRTKMTTGQSVLRRARREAKEISRVSQLSSRLANNQILARSQIRRAPESMVNDYRVAHQPGSAIIRAPKKRPGSGSSVKTHYETEWTRPSPGTGLGVGNADKEARLLALKRGAAAAPPSYTAKSSAPTVHAPKKRAITSTSTTTTAKTAAPKEKRRAYDYDDDDELFGVVTKPTKKARLTVEDLESGSGGGGADDDGLFGSDDDTKSNPKRKSRAVSPPRKERERDRPRTEQRDDRSYDTPKKTIRSSAPVSSSPASYKPPAPRAGSPPKSQMSGGPARKKNVDIFMRLKKK